MINVIKSVLMVGMVQTALTNAMNTATAVTDLTEPVILDVRPDGKEYTAKIHVMKKCMGSIVLRNVARVLNLNNVNTLMGLV